MRRQTPLPRTRQSWLKGGRGAFALLLSVLLLSSPAAADDLMVDYVGELVRNDGHSISGVFQLDVALYDNDDAEEAFWSETHYVGVVSGEFRLRLGTETPLPADRADADAVFIIEFDGSEIIHEPIVLTPAPAVPAGAEDFEEYFLTFGSEDVIEVTFAEVADLALFAQEAEHAFDCDTLDGRSAEDLLGPLSTIQGDLSEHFSDLDLHGGSRVQVSSQTTVLQRAGGEGGSRYTRMCPNGYVAVGIRGGAGALVDSVEVVCAAIE